MRPIGVCTWTFGDRSLADILDRVKAAGLDGVELFGNLRTYEPRAVWQLLEERGLQVFSLTPDNVDLAHPDHQERQRAIDYYLQLLDFAAALGHPLVSCHGYVGRVRALASQEQELAWLEEGVALLAEKARSLGLRLVMEVLNRYESHLLNTATQAQAFVDAVAAPNVGILLDAYHMNIDETDLVRAIHVAGERLWLFHVADSNRQGIGGGHTDFPAVFQALDELDYHGPLILECTAPGPDPFTAIKGEDSLDRLAVYHRQSVEWIAAHRSPTLRKGQL